MFAGGTDLWEMLTVDRRQQHPLTQSHPTGCLFLETVLLLVTVSSYNYLHFLKITSIMILFEDKCKVLTIIISLPFLAPPSSFNLSNAEERVPQLRLKCKKYKMVNSLTYLLLVLTKQWCIRPAQILTQEMCLYFLY